ACRVSVDVRPRARSPRDTPPPCVSEAPPAVREASGPSAARLVVTLPAQNLDVVDDRVVGAKGGEVAEEERQLSLLGEARGQPGGSGDPQVPRSEEHTSELQSP